MAFDVEAAKAAGYTQQEIDAYLQAKPETKVIAPVAPGQEVDPGEPPPPPSADSYQQAGTGDYTPGLATAGIVAGALGVPAAIGYGVKAGLSGVANKGGQVMDLAKQGVGALQQQAQTSALTESRLQNRPGFGGAPASAPAPAAPVAPQAPAAPAAMPAPQAQAPAQSSMMNKASDVVRKLALDKVLKGAGVAAGAYEMGKGLFGTSPEEIAIMKQAEEKKRAQGWKPMNER